MQTKKMGDGHKEKTEDGGQNVNLPPDIIHEILLRLPVKPLCQSKLVSKSWQSLISDPNFVANYNKAAFANEEVFLSRRRLIFTFIDRSERQGIYSLDVDQFLSENPNAGSDSLVAAPTELGYNTATSVWGPFVHYSCYGLVLAWLYSADSSFSHHSLIHPVTKKSNKLPIPPIWRPFRKLYYFQLYGVGFDHYTNDYKVINGQDYDGGVVFSVYTLQTNSWRLIDYIFPYQVLDFDGIMVSGGVHCMARKIADESLVIISFLLAEEMIREIALPPNATTHSKLGAFRNWLCVTSGSAYSTSSSNEFWVMKKYGASESWTKMRVSIPYKKLSHSRFWTKSHDLIVIDGSLVMYNFNDDTYWTLSIGIVGNVSNIGIYVETLPTNSSINKQVPMEKNPLSVTSGAINSHSKKAKARRRRRKSKVE